MTYRALRCPCGDPICKHWHVSDVAEMQGVRFTQAQAELVARVLNNEEAADAAASADVDSAMKAIGLTTEIPFVLVILPRNLGPSRSTPRGHSALWAAADMVVEWSDGEFHIVKDKSR